LAKSTVETIDHDRVPQVAVKSIQIRINIQQQVGRKRPQAVVNVSTLLHCPQGSIKMGAPADQADAPAITSPSQPPLK
jgi:hypothetical protein